MEVSRHGVLEELIAPLNTNELFPNGWISSSFESSLASYQNHPLPPDFLLSSSNSSLEEDSTFACPLADIFKKPRTPPLPPPPAVEGVHGREARQLFVNGSGSANKISCRELEEEMKMKKKKKKKKKKASGQPSKNLMAERRRRKRLHDRLSMLRSIIPKISKMDRTSIVADAIDYIKDLLHRINQLREVREYPTGFKPHDELRNPTWSPKFDVERRHEDTRIEICCATKPGLMLSTVSTLEAIGLDIQHCVISCFTTDFSFQASCTEAMEHPTVVRRPEDIKQVLFKTAGYGGRCLYEK